jgi:hypothetical protein
VVQKEKSIEQHEGMLPGAAVLVVLYRVPACPIQVVALNVHIHTCCVEQIKKGRYRLCDQESAEGKGGSDGQSF